MPIIMNSRTDPTFFLHHLQTVGLTQSWLPFRQSQYVQEVLHGDIPVRSRHADGICSILSVVVLRHWAKHNVSSEVIAELHKQHLATEVSDLADGALRGATAEPGSIQYVEQMLRRLGLMVPQLMPFPKPAPAIDSAVNLGNCAMSFHAQGVDGHTIAINGSYRAIFDPNVGFVKGKNGEDFKSILRALVNTYYPEYKNVTTSLLPCR